MGRGSSVESTGLSPLSRGETLDERTKDFCLKSRGPVQTEPQMPNNNKEMNYLRLNVNIRVLLPEIPQVSADKTVCIKAFLNLGDRC